MPGPETLCVYQFKVVLRGIRPMIWRRLSRCHGDSRVITLDGFEPSHASLRRMGINNEFNYR